MPADMIAVGLQRLLSESAQGSIQMQETIKRWGNGGLVVGAVTGFAVVFVEHVATGAIKSAIEYPLMMGIFALPCALVGLTIGLCIALCRRQ